MANLITDDRSARRLAQAIASDIELYNEEAVASGADLTREVAEGRALFEGRVSPSLHAVFDEELKARSPGVRYASANPTADTGTVPESFFQDETDRGVPTMAVTTTPQTASAKAGAMLAALVVVAVIVYFLLG